MPTGVATESFPVQEVHGQIFRGHYDAGRARMHIVEPLENAADSAHFGYLHNQLTVPWTPVVGVVQIVRTYLPVGPLDQQGCLSLVRGTQRPATSGLVCGRRLGLRSWYRQFFPELAAGGRSSAARSGNVVPPGIPVE